MNGKKLKLNIICYQKKKKSIEKENNKLLYKIITALSDNYEDKNIIEIDEEENNINEDENNEQYKITPLDFEKDLLLNIGNKTVLSMFNSLCKAGNKQFKHWKQVHKTKAFLEALSSLVGITFNELIKYTSGSIHERATLTHPQVAINIAQWISPKFDVKVSGWIY